MNNCMDENKFITCVKESINLQKLKLSALQKVLEVFETPAHIEPILVDAPEIKKEILVLKTPSSILTKPAEKLKKQSISLDSKHTINSVLNKHKIINKAPLNRSNWTEKDDTALIDMTIIGQGMDVISQTLNRSILSIHNRRSVLLQDGKFKRPAKERNRPVDGANDSGFF